MARWFGTVSITLLALTLLWGTPACKRKQRQVVPRTPARCLTELGRAAASDDAGRVHDLLDERSRWSIISAHKALKKMCAQIEAHYPAAQRARASARCHLAASVNTPRAYFQLLARREGLVKQLRGVARIEAGAVPEPKQQQLQLTVPGGGQVRLCEDDGVWGLCSWRARFDQLKVKAARDLATVEENVATYRRGAR